MKPMFERGIEGGGRRVSIPESLRDIDTGRLVKRFAQLSPGAQYEIIERIKKLKESVEVRPEKLAENAIVLTEIYRAMEEARKSGRQAAGGKEQVYPPRQGRGDSEEASVLIEEIEEILDLRLDSPQKKSKIHMK